MWRAARSLKLMPFNEESAVRAPRLDDPADLAVGHETDTR